MSTRATLDSLWDFSLALYAQPGVADACLRLQDEHGLNVNLLLWCVWLECKGLFPDQAQLEQAQRQTHGWDQNYVVPLRQLRQRMKAEFGTRDLAIEQVRRQIKEAELAAERQLQMQLQSLSCGWWPIAEGLSAGRWKNGPFESENLRRYLAAAGVDCSAVKLLAQCVTGALRNILSN